MRLVVSLPLALALALALGTPIGPGGLHAADAALPATLRARFVAELGPLALEEYAPPHVSERHNGALVLLEASATLALDEAQRAELPSLIAKAVTDWTEADLDRAREIVDSNPDAIDCLSTLPAYRRGNFDLRYGDGSRMQYPGMFRIQDATQLMHLYGLLALAESRTDDAIATIESLASLASMLYREPAIWMFVFGGAAEKRQINLAAQLVTAHTLDDASMARIGNSLLEIDVSALYRRSLGHAALCAIEDLRAETLFGEAAMPSFFDAGPRSRRYLQRVHESRYRRIWDRAWTATAGGWVVDRYVEALLDAAASIDDVYLESRPKLEAVERESWVFVPGGNLVSGRSLVRDVGRNQATLAARQMLRLTLDVTRHGRRHGAYPREIDRFAGARSPNALSGSEPGYLRRGDGSARLVAPGARTVWEKQIVAGSNTRLPFAVELPPLSRP